MIDLDTTIESIDPSLFYEEHISLEEVIVLLYHCQVEFVRDLLDRFADKLDAEERIAIENDISQLEEKRDK